MLHSPMMDEDPHRTLGLLLVEGFSLMSYASVIEPFRAANTLAERELYRWRHVSIDGQPVRASNGATILADCSVGEKLECDTLFVVAGGDPATFSHKPTFAWLRELGRGAVRLAGVSGGPFLLARAGVLDGYRATIHWDHHAAFIEAFPDLDIEPGLFVIDRRRLTCAGGTAGLDLAIELIERDHGHSLAARVSDWFIRTEPRSADGAQRLGLRERYRVTNDRVLKVLAKMEAAIEAPFPMSALARSAGVSRRQLERLFATHLNGSVGAIYLQIRLDQAAHLLRRTAMSVTEIAIASGFQSVSHFSRVYKNRFGHPPRDERRPAEQY
jgi:transcriptional regulator GlxA family with amidase domain